MYFWIDDSEVKDSSYNLFNKYVAIDFRYENNKIDDLNGIIGFKVLKCFEKDNNKNRNLFELLDDTLMKISPSNSVLSIGTVTDWKGERTYLKLIKPGIDEEFSHYLIGFIYSKDVDLNNLAQVSRCINVKYAYGIYWMMVLKISLIIIT